MILLKKYIILLYLIAVIFAGYSFILTFHSGIKNNNCIMNNYFSENSIFIYPTSYTDISSNYGYRILYDSSNFHDGIDFLAPQGSDIIASSSGYVSYASFMQGYGNTIIITHDNNIQTLYGHLSENFIVSVGQTVSQGQIIGQVGPKYLSNGSLNGNTTGPHLHFTIIKGNSKINPQNILNK